VPLLTGAEGVPTRSRAAGACCSSAPSGRRRSRCRRWPSVRAVLREPSLARRHADQLEDHLESIQRLRKLDEHLAATPRASPRRSAEPGARAREAAARWAASATWAACRTCCSSSTPTRKDLAIQEAKLHIPVVAMVDSNCDPDGVDYPIPGNDDAARAISLYCDLIAAPRSTAWRANRAQSFDLGAWKPRSRKRSTKRWKLPAEEPAPKRLPRPRRRQPKRRRAHPDLSVTVAALHHRGGAWR
jgi:hypothetical protein